MAPRYPHEAEFVLRSLRFRREREATWHELDEIVSKAERTGVRSLTARELSRLPVLYRATLSSLGAARSISLDHGLLEYLEVLSSRAYFVVYGTRRHLRDAVVDFAARDFPRAVRRFKWHLLAAAAIMLLGAAVGMALTLKDPDRFYSFVQAEYAQGRDPSASTEELRETLYEADETMADRLTAFASFLFTHNAKIGMLCFALGFAAGIPVILLMFVNGLLLGAFAALFQSRGLGPDFWGWVLPHGVTEILALLLCAAGGLALGQSLVFPGAYSRLENLARRGREAAVVVLGAVVMFLIAGLIEGLFRQLVTDIHVRYGLIITSLVGWSLYFGLAGRSGRRRERAA